MSETVFVTGLNDWLFLIVRWAHIISAVLWVGGSAFMALVIYPLRREAAFAAALPNIGVRYRQLAHAVIALLAVSGIALMLERIYISSVPPLWFVLLGIKLAIAVWMLFIIASKRGGRANLATRGWVAKASFLLGYNALLALGAAAIFIATLMQRLFEIGANG